MAYSMNSTNYMTNSENEDSNNEQSSWDLYANDFNYGMQSSSSMVSTSHKCKPTKFVIDHDLEDTATSPAHSPKINDFSGLYDMMSQKLDAVEFSQEKGQAFQKNEEIIMELLETELRRKGLCLVPISMVVNCLGSN
ncbi:hypothetical protein RND81_05G214000 [Saponaria officinalis]|uniref:Uncharacterized protein n=1 Tax=Saponaria officinalis TaxID=3572 RepID=A0AAW1L2W7_SAPOF